MHCDMDSADEEVVCKANVRALWRAGLKPTSLLQNAWHKQALMMNPPAHSLIQEFTEKKSKWNK